MSSKKKKNIINWREREKKTDNIYVLLLLLFQRKLYLISNIAYQKIIFSKKSKFFIKESILGKNKRKKKMGLNLKMKNDSMEERKKIIIK